MQVLHKSSVDQNNVCPDSVYDLAGHSSDLEQWLQENGAKFPKVNLQNYDAENRGVHACCDIPPNEVIIEIPLKCLITVEMGKNTAVGQVVESARLRLDAPKHVYLMLFILQDRKNPDSFFRPYYNILPKDLTNMPIFWGPEKLDWLKGSHLLVQIAERRHAIEADYVSICSVYPEFSKLATLQEFLWARMCVCSRNFGVVINGLQTGVLVPYGDMLNHRRPQQTKWNYVNESSSFVISSLENIPSGSQVYDSYGPKSNHRFLLNYGFSIEKNDTDMCPNEVPIAFGLDALDPLLSHKLPLWITDIGFFQRPSDEQQKVPGSVTHKCDKNAGFIWLRINAMDSEVSRSVLSVLRVACADMMDWQIISTDGNILHKTARDIKVPISSKNEAAALQRLKLILQIYINQYPTSIEQDEESLNNTSLLPLFSDHRNAVIQVHGEKVVLHHWMQLADVGLACLSASTEAQILALCQNVNRHVYNYCINSILQLRKQEMLKLNGLMLRSCQPMYT